MKDDVKYRFGEKLRAVRERRGITLKAVAREAGLSESLISQIERNKVSPSLDTLLTLAEVLEIDPDYLFRDLKKNRDVTVVKAGDRKSYLQPKVAFHLLTSMRELSDQHAIEAYLLEIEPGGSKGNEEYGHIGRELGFILEGSAQLTYGVSTYKIEAGDAVSFSSDVPHNLENTGKGLLRTVWVVTPPKNIHL